MYMVSNPINLHTLIQTFKPNFLLCDYLEKSVRE